MVVQKSKAKEEKIDLEERKQRMLSELSNEPSAIVALAYFYAKSFESYGEDVTTRWQTAMIQTDALNRAYKKGVEDALKEMKGSKDNGI